MTDREIIHGEIIGHRAWDLVGATSHPRLGSLNWDAEWPTRTWLTAACGGGLDHEAPDEGCNCGIHAARDRTHLYTMHYTTGSDFTVEDLYDRRHLRIVTGEVALAGKVIPGSQGWLAEKARVFRLWIPHAHWRIGMFLADAYRVPIILTNPTRQEHAHV